jgi:D-alanine--poly(phosphoribitol) ligase subunit 1
MSNHHPDVIDQFLFAAASRPAHPAIVMSGRAMNYAAFEARVRSFAGHYARGTGPAVLIALPQGVEAYAAMLGAGLAGCYYAPLNIHAPLEKLQSIVRIMRPDIIVCGPDLSLPLAAAAPSALLVDPAEPAVAPMAGRGPRHEIAYVIFTSGTTGIPKGVVIPRTALNHFVAWVKDSKTITADDRVAQFSTISFDVSVTDIYGALSMGAALYPIVRRLDRMFPARVVGREKLTVWNSTPSVISLMMQAGEVTHELLGSLRLINTCGEPLLPVHLECVFSALPDVVFQNSYGPTETTVTMTEIRLTPDNFRSACGHTVTIGSPIANTSILLCGGAHPDEGEIVITGPQLALEYLGDPEKTAAVFRTVDVDGTPTRAYFSGDWAERRDGHIYFKERIDHQVKIRGFRIELDEIATMIHHQGFAVTCVLKWRDELAAVIERRSDLDFDEAQLRGALAQKLDAYAIPSIIRRIDLIPRTQNDKIDRKAVSEWLDTHA